MTAPRKWCLCGHARDQHLNGAATSPEPDSRWYGLCAECDCAVFSDRDNQVGLTTWVMAQKGMGSIPHRCGALCRTPAVAEHVCNLNHEDLTGTCPSYGCHATHVVVRPTVTAEQDGYAAGWHDGYRTGVLDEQRAPSVNRAVVRPGEQARS